VKVWLKRNPRDSRALWRLEDENGKVVVETSSGRVLQQWAKKHNATVVRVEEQ
jgi:hypothetical protein